MDLWLYFQEYGEKDTLNLSHVQGKVGYCQEITSLGERHIRFQYHKSPHFPKNGNITTFLA
jgi:hypothetical protein